MIITRYLRREVIFTMLTVTTVIVFIFVCNRFVHYLGFVASGRYATHLLIYLVMLQIPILFALLLPLGLFLGILLAYGRLYADSEMTVLTACGMRPRQLLWITVKIACLVAVVVAILVTWVNPRILENRDKLLDLAKTSVVMDTIMPGQFKRSDDGRNVLYMKSMSRTRQHFRDIFVAQHAIQHGWTVLSAKRGYQMTDEQTGDQFMVTSDGYRYQGEPGQKDFQVIQFQNYGVRLNRPESTGQSAGEEIVPTHELLKQASRNPEYMAELQWRFSMPLSALVLALLALPLAQVKPRQGKFAQLLPAILLYIVYANMMFVSRSWLEVGTIPAWIGLWWVHVMMLGFASLAYGKRWVHR